MNNNENRNIAIKIILLILAIIFLWLLSQDLKAAEFDYQNASREHLLTRCLYFAQRLQQVQHEHKSTTQQLEIALNQVNTYQTYIQVQNDRVNRLEVNITGLQSQLVYYSDYHYNQFTPAFDIQIGAGTSLNLSLSSKLFLYQGFYGFIRFDGYYNYAFNSYFNILYGAAIVGFGWGF